MPGSVPSDELETVDETVGSGDAPLKMLDSEDANPYVSLPGVGGVGVGVGGVGVGVGGGTTTAAAARGLRGIVATG